MDTIYALATGSSLPAAIAIIRVSGPDTGAALERMGVDRTSLSPRMLVRADIAEPDSGELLDRGLVAWFPGPDSFTGEDYCELHCHGSVSTVQGLLDSLSKLFRLRLAEPGEFARRAFDNGRIGLTELEGLADLMVAETRAQRVLALRNSGGHLGRAANGWQDRLLDILSRVEAILDFSDEGDVDVGVGDLAKDIAALEATLAAVLAQCGIGERIRNGLRIAVVGAPNVGKSTFVNSLAGRDVAIVHEEAGTTRDVVEVRLDLGGYPVDICDTAGLRDAAGAVEAEGIRRARATAETADLVLVLVDRFSAEMKSYFKTESEATCWYIETKADLLSKSVNCGNIGDNQYRISALSGAGLSSLISGLTAFVGSTVFVGEGPLVTRQRQVRAVSDVADALGRARETLDRPEIAAEQLRVALQAIAVFVGRADVEDMLDRLFGEFCIGK